MLATATAVEALKQNGFRPVVVYDYPSPRIIAEKDEETYDFSFPSNPLEENANTDSSHLVWEVEIDGAKTYKETFTRKDGSHEDGSEFTYKIFPDFVRNYSKYSETEKIKKRYPEYFEGKE